jgi:GNAT superfamily N-acetyltransferase
MINKVLKIDKSNLDILVTFIHNNPIGRIHFRYFEKRDFTIVKNHLVANLYFENEECVGYGHLDEETKGGRTWLGVIVADKHQGKGFGNFIIDDLIGFPYVKSIYLSVDKTNRTAVHLYLKKGFKIIEDLTDKVIMCLAR